MTTLIFNKNEINTSEEAKEYLNYHGGQLTPQEKEIFNDDRLQSDIPLLQNTAELLNNLKISQEKVNNERMGLSTDGTTLLIALLKEQKGNSTPYQIVNGSLSLSLSLSLINLLIKSLASLKTFCLVKQMLFRIKKLKQS